MSAAWSVTYETATIQAGTAPTTAEAERIAANVHDSYVVKGLNPDALAWHVEADRRMGKIHRPVAERFWLHVDKRGPDECWLWTGSKSGGTGYGNVLVDRERGNAGAHRVSWELHNGPVPAGMEICHRCDVRACVNPAHLFVGTRSDNMRDAYRKGRTVQQTRPFLLVRGEQVNTARLTEEQVKQIRARYSDGQTITALAREYGVVRSAVWDVVRRHSWKHVEEDRRCSTCQTWLSRYGNCPQCLESEVQRETEL